MLKTPNINKNKRIYHELKHANIARSKPANFNWEDPFLLEDQLTEEERMIRDTAKAYCQDKLMPRIIEANRNEVFHREIMNEMGELGLLGSTIPEEFGGVGANYTSYGLVAREVERLIVDIALQCQFNHH